MPSKAFPEILYLYDFAHGKMAWVLLADAANFHMHTWLPFLQRICGFCLFLCGSVIGKLISPFILIFQLSSLSL